MALRVPFIFQLIVVSQLLRARGLDVNVADAGFLNALLLLLDCPVV